jgi:hypothetical protein
VSRLKSAAFDYQSVKLKWCQTQEKGFDRFGHGNYGSVINVFFLGVKIRGTHEPCCNAYFFDIKTDQ